MKVFNLSGSSRANVGKKDAAHLRAQDLVPCVVYGGASQVFFSVKYNDLRHLIYTPEVYTVNISVDGKEYNTIMQEIQFNGVSDKIMHIDFMELDNNKPIVIDIPVKLSGTAAGVRTGGKLVSNVRKLKVRAFVKDLPDFISVNVEPLEIGGVVKVSQMKIDGVTFLDAPNVVIAAVRMTRAAAAAATEAAAPAKKK
ncbi:MAG: 50S ribosomal protein L25/general stress protein Ctc [Bacteroidota bacterium]|jgi:large subunit ribosomal protein L25